MAGVVEALAAAAVLAAALGVEEISAAVARVEAGSALVWVFFSAQPLRSLRLCGKPAFKNHRRVAENAEVARRISN